MQIGLNSEHPRGGKSYHIQTEDAGLSNPVITSHLFLSGTIIETVQSRYDDLIKGDESAQRLLQGRMRAQHQALLERLEAGDFDQLKPRLVSNPRQIPLARDMPAAAAPADSAADASPLHAPAAVAPPTPTPTPKGERVPSGEPEELTPARAAPAGYSGRLWETRLSHGASIPATMLHAYSSLGDD